MKAYAEYRPGSDRWFPPTPAHWIDTPVWTLFTRVARKGYSDETLLSVYREHGVIPKDSRDDNNNRPSDDLSSYQLVEPGDLVVNKMKAWQGSLSISGFRGIVSPAYFVYRPHHESDDRFLHHLLRSRPLIAAYIGMSKGVRINQWDLEPQTFSRLKLPLPPIEEQRVIADYIDRETSRVDTLIEEQQRLIEILDERRDAVIVETTTKGVSPGQLLVESGVEWLGDIPEGWSVKALRRCGTFLTGSTPSTSDRNNFAEESNERPWVRPQDMSSRTRASAWLTEAGWRQLRPVPAGSVLVGCIAYSLGSVGYLPVAATTNQQITSIIPVEDGRYLYYVLCAANSELWAASQINRVPILNNQRLGAIRVPVPPVEEQRLIAAYLDEQTDNIDRAKTEAARFIELARERRSALITAAVTGQIDVREMV